MTTDTRRPPRRPDVLIAYTAPGWHAMHTLTTVGLKVRCLLPIGPTAKRLGGHAGLGGREVIGWRGKSPVGGAVFFTWDRLLKQHLEIQPIGWLPIEPTKAAA